MYSSMGLTPYASSDLYWLLIDLQEANPDTFIKKGGAQQIREIFSLLSQGDFTRVVSHPLIRKLTAAYLFRRSLFNSTMHEYDFDEVVRAGLASLIIPSPKNISISCGMCTSIFESNSFSKDFHLSK